MNPFVQKRYKVHPSTRKSELINALQGLTSARIDREHYTHFTIKELYRELERAKEAQLAGTESGLVYRKEKPPRNKT